MKYAWLPALSLALASNIPAMPIQAKPSGVPVHPSARCAAFWSGMTRIAQQGSEQYTIMTARKEAWQAHAAAAIGAEKARQIVNNDGPAIGSQVRALSNDPDALQAFAADYSDCETVPAGGTAIASHSTPPATPAPVPTVSEKDKASGEMALKCAAMARLYEAEDNFILIDSYGKSSTYLSIFRHFRPDLSEGDIERGMQKGKAEFSRLYAQNLAEYRRASSAGIPANQIDLTNTEYFVEARKCAQMANVMSRFVKK